MRRVERRAYARRGTEDRRAAVVLVAPHPLESGEPMMGVRQNMDVGLVVIDQNRIPSRFCQCADHSNRVLPGSEAQDDIRMEQHLVQVICKDKAIGWRDRGERLLITFRTQAVRGKGMVPPGRTPRRDSRRCGRERQGLPGSAWSCPRRRRPPRRRRRRRPDPEPSGGRTGSSGTSSSGTGSRTGGGRNQFPKITPQSEPRPVASRARRMHQAPAVCSVSALK